MSHDELARRLGVPLIPRLNPDLDQTLRPLEPNPVVAVCGECGLQITRVMGYVCGSARCPAGFGSRVVC